MPRSCLVKLAMSTQQTEAGFCWFFNMQMVFLYLFKTKPSSKLSCKDCLLFQMHLFLKAVTAGRLQLTLLQKLVPYSTFENAGLLLDPVPAIHFLHSNSRNSVKFTGK